METSARGLGGGADACGGTARPVRPRPCGSRRGARGRGRPAARVRRRAARRAAARRALHDVGKLAVPDGVLLKPGALTTDELVEIRAHPRTRGPDGRRERGALRALPTCSTTTSAGTATATRRARRRAIPLEARVLAVADAFDAMTCDRPYRRALPVGHALAEVVRCAGSSSIRTGRARQIPSSWEPKAESARVAA